MVVPRTVAPLRGRWTRAVGAFTLTFAVACGATVLSAATKQMLADPHPGPSGGSTAPERQPGPPAWMEVDVLGDTRGIFTLSRSDFAGEALFVTPPPVVQWDAIVQAGPGGPRPPDDQVAAGTGAGAAGRVVEVTNGSVRIYDKTGVPVTGIVPLSTMFPPAPGTFVFDPKVLFDQASGRFFVVVLEVGFSGAVCGSAVVSSAIRIAVSTNATPGTTGPADWTFFSASGLMAIGGTTTWADYPSIGADGNSLFVTTNQFSDGACSFRGSNIRVYDKAALVAGVYSAVDVTFDVAVTPGVGTIQPAHVYGATDNGGFYLISRFGPGAYRLYNITGDPAAPVVATALFPWAGGAFPGDTSADQCVAAGIDLDTLSGRLMNAIYRSGRLWTVQTAQADPDGQTEVVWHQITTNSYPGGVPAIAQSGFLNGSGVDPWTYTPSINVNSGGDALINFMQSSGIECASMYAAVRLNADPPGTLQTQALARASGGFYDSVGATAMERWGDYSGNAVDPADNCFWISNEYVSVSAAAASVWGTHIAKFCSSNEGACCFGPKTCGMRTAAQCAAQGGTFRGLGTKCPTQNVHTAQHSTGTIVHWVDPAIDCNSIIPLVQLSDCCSAHPSPACDTPSCAGAVCGVLPHCCSDGWDNACAQAAQSLCGTLCSSTGACTPGVPIDPWVTSDDPAERSCNQFGLAPEPPIPANFFYPGSQPFVGQVCYAGEPLGATPFGVFDVADTLVRRPAGDPFDRCSIPGFQIDIPIEIVALHLVTVQPIVVTGIQPPQLWSVKLELSDVVPPPPGQMTVRKTHCNGGTWDSVLQVQPRFTFTRIDDPSQIRVLDTGAMGFPPIQLPSVTENLPWVHDLDPNLHLDGDCTTSFHPGIEDPVQTTDCDCNLNLVQDQCDVANGAQDCNRNNRPDECDPDGDLDIAPDDCDNCATISNAGQENSDGDRFGDACDLCPFLGERLENDHDGDRVTEIPNIDFPVGDNCPCVPNRDQVDLDGDQVGNVCDNCPGVANSGQENLDGDGFGDACDCDPANPANPVPLEASGVGFTVPGNKHMVSWAAAPGATSHDVARGEIPALPVGPGGGDETCFDSVPGTSLLDTTVPVAGSPLWYLTRGANPCGVGLWGTERRNVPGPPTFPPRNTAICP